MQKTKKTTKNKTKNKTNEAIQIIKKYELLSKGENKKIIGMVGKQGGLLKRFKESEEFFNHAGHSKFNIYFKMEN